MSARTTGTVERYVYDSLPMFLCIRLCLVQNMQFLVTRRHPRGYGSSQLHAHLLNLLLLRPQEVELDHARDTLASDICPGLEVQPESIFFRRQRGAHG
jgi:hypothetical protein